MQEDIRQLAMRFVILTEGQLIGQKILAKSYEAWGLKQEMLRRCGDEHTETYIAQAREIYTMIHG